MRPRLKPVLRRVERDPRTLQIGVHPLRAVVLADLEPPMRRVIDSLDGTRTLPEVIAASELAEPVVRELLERLMAHGLLDDASAHPGLLAGLPSSERERLRPDLDALSLTSADGGIGALRRRRSAQVRVHGAGRVGAQVVALLAAAGVGHLCVVDPGTARREDVVPGGLGWTEVGGSREAGAVAVARRLAPSVNAWPGQSASRLGDGVRPDLVVLAPVEPLDPLLVRDLGTRRIPHLLVTAYERCGSVGPFVMPGVTPCLGCLDLIRRDRDPAWPAVRARLGGFPAGEIACDTVLSTLVAAQAAGLALAYVDAGLVSNHTVDVMPDWRWRLRIWESHPECRCSRYATAKLTMVA
ncbi:ThiF family adenylyltransferase [Streptosporangiaceae bacterium NEAU-GS5]|nr:ThiF family adenylyltransferase [Streptosporangiaceae bacterium NEAU-GS5]